MATAAEIFGDLWRINGAAPDLSGIRVHREADGLCESYGAVALTIGTDIFFRAGSFEPHTRAGLWLLAHEAAHAVQQRSGVIDGTLACGDAVLGPPGGAAEREADAAASAVLAGQRFEFRARPGTVPRRPVVQRYMAWEHLVLGNLAPPDVRNAVAAAAGETNADGARQLQAQCALLEELGRDPANVDTGRLGERYPGVETLRLPGSGVVVTLGELNILPDYLSNPAGVGSAPASFVLPLVQSIRAQGLVELGRLIGRPPGRARIPGAMRYSGRHRETEFYEARQIDSAGRRAGFPRWELYSSVVGRNAAHFAPFSWYRWQEYHLMAREMIGGAATMTSAGRDELRARARLYAAYADHFLQDSFAAGHMINKTLVMQWYIEWLGKSRIPIADRRLLAAMTSEHQPLLHGPGYYYPEPDETGARLHPRGHAGAHLVRDPQTAADAHTLDERIEASGVTGRTPRERRSAYLRYLAFLNSSVAQLGAGIAHEHFNRRSLTVASGPGGPRYRIWGDRTMLAAGTGAGAGTGLAAEAAAASRRAISELLRHGSTSVSSRDIFESFPDRVDVDGVLLPLPEWHEKHLRDHCLPELFGSARTQVSRVLLSVISRHMGVPSAHHAALRAEARQGNIG